jgi:MATE family multidrug resistance protein
VNKQILKLAIPNIISNITVPLLGLVDLALLGHLKGNVEIYIGAIALGGMIFNFIYMGFGFLRMGTSGFTAQAFGATNPKEQFLILSRALFIAVTSSLLILVLQIPIELLSFKILEGSPEVESFARQYFYIRIWAAPATISLYAITGWFIGMQNARIPMIIAIVINVLNIGFNAFFVYGMGMKSDGVALGTVIAQYSGLILAIYFYLKKYRKLNIYWSIKDSLQKTELKRFIGVNSNILIRTVLLIFALSFFTAQSAKISTTILAVNNLLFQFFLIFSFFIDGFAYAAEALVGKFIGAEKQDDLRKVIRQLFKWGLFLAIPFSLSYFIFGENLLYILTSDHSIIESCSPYLFWVALIPVISFVAFLYDGVFIGATASKPMRNGMIISTVFVFLPSYYLLEPQMGNHGLWLALILFMASRGIVLYFFSRNAIYNMKID